MASRTAFIIGDSISNAYHPLARSLLQDRGIAIEWFQGGSSDQVFPQASEHGG